MQNDFDIIFTGRLRSGFDPESVLDAFCKRFQIGPDTARAMLQSRQEIVIKKDLASDDAYKFKEALESLGMDVRLQALHDNIADDSADLELMPKGETGAGDLPVIDAASRFLHRSGVECPKCGARQPHAEACRECGVVFAKYYAQSVQEKPSAEDARVSAAREAARRSTARRRNTRMLNAAVGVAVLALVGGLAYYYFAAQQL